jgi:nitrite reductase/ring-hydroxylating ferredoxin subunit
MAATNGSATTNDTGALRGRFGLPIPNGWFAVAESAELAPGDVRAAHYFGRELVVFRDEGGVARVADAFCPHLGAHLGIGGEVVGDTIRCPFHHWRYDGESGRCVEIPYLADDGRIPQRACIRTYATAEQAGLVFAWHHLEDEPPRYEVPTVAEFSDPEWTGADVREFFVDTNCQEMAENNSDYAHFIYVHGSQAMPEADVFVDGHYKRVTSPRIQELGGEFVRESYGLGLGVLHVGDALVFLSSTTPIDEEHVHVRWSFTAPKQAGEEMRTMMMESFLGGVAQDIPIWNNKIYVERPVLVKGDGPIGEYRKWVKQFYSDPVRSKQ